MEIIVYFLTVVPTGVAMLAAAAWYDYKYVRTVKAI